MERDFKENEINKKDKMAALLQWELILFRPQKVKKRINTIARSLREIFLISSIIIIIKKAVMPKIVLNQKTSYSLGNFHISNY